MTDVIPKNNRVPRHIQRDALNLRRDETGARFWSVSLDHAQLTYFEVGPNCRFDEHWHPSEQITLVLEGMLYFETSSGVDEVGASEVMAIPANVPHAVFTRELAAKAVDAWSPVNKTYADEP
jgi:quercetin dioxygenase-like cupin family protein